MNTRRTILPIVLGVFLLFVGFPYRASASIGAGSGSLSFGTVAIGASSTMSTSVTNNGDGAASLSVAVTGSGYSLVSAPSSLQPGQSGTITVRFAPSTTGYLTGNVAIASPYGGTDISLNGTAVPAQPIISVSPGSLSFGSIAVGDHLDPLTVTIRNTGSATLVGTATVSDAAFKLSGSTNYTISPGASTPITVAFAPTTPKNYSATLTLTGGGGATVSLSGTATAPPKLSVSPSPLDFGRVDLNGSATLYLTVTNTGGGTLTGNCSVSGEFFMQGGVYSLTTGQSKQVPVVYRPLNEGTHTGLATLTGGGGATVNLTGTGQAPSAKPSISPPSLNFGSVNVGSTSTVQNITVQNTYDGPVTISLAIDDPFIVTSSSSFYLGINQQATVGVAFRPTSGGQATRSITFVANSTDGGMGYISATLSGTGIASATPIISVTPPSLDYGNVAVGQSKTLGFVVKNVGAGTLTGTASISADGYSVVSGGSYSLAAGRSATVNVRYTPTKAALQKGAVSFTGGGGATRTVSGTGYIPAATPEITVTPAQLDFGSVAINGGSRDLTFTVTNTGGGVLSGVATTAAPCFSITAGGSYSLNAGQSHTVTVQFRPSSAIAYSGTVAFTGAAGAARPVTGQGYVAALNPLIAVTPSELNFADVPTGQIAELSFTVTNVGNGTLSGVASTSAAGFTIIDGNSYSLAAGESRTVIVQFSPSAIQSYSGQVGFTGGGGASRPVRGNGVEPSGSPAISVTPASLDFGSVVTGNPKTMQFTVSSVGTGPLIGSVSINGTAFRVSGDSNYALLPGQSKQISVEFNPYIVSGYTGTATFTGATGATRPLTGQGVTSSSGMLMVHPDRIDYGLVAVGESKSNYFLLTNVGGGTINGTATSLADAFPCYQNFTLNAGQQTHADISFYPAKNIYYEGAILFAADTGQFRGVTGTGYYSGPIPTEPKILVTPDKIDFGRVYWDERPTASFNVTNIGGGILSGTATCSHAWFPLTSGTSYSLASGESAKVSVQFWPTGYGGASTDVYFSGGGGATRQVYGYSLGTMPSDPRFEVTPYLLDFGQVEVGSSKTLQFTLRSTSEAYMDIEALTHDTLNFKVNPANVSLWFGTRVVDVTYTPQTLGPHSDVVDFRAIKWTDEGDKYVTYYVGRSVRGEGVGRGPVLSVTPASQEYGHLYIGESKTLSFTVTNLGVGTLVGTASVPGPAFTIADGNYSLTAGASKVINVKFTPTTEGNFNQAVTFTGCGGATRYVSGTASARRPQLTVTPEVLSFGTMQLGQSATKTFAVTNTGTATLTGHAEVTSESDTFDVPPIQDPGLLRVVSLNYSYYDWVVNNVDALTGTATPYTQFAVGAPFYGSYRTYDEGYDDPTVLDYFFTTMAYIGDNKLRAIRYEGYSCSAYDVDFTTGAATLVPTFTDFSAFSGYYTHYGYTGANYFSSTMAYIGNNTLRVVTLFQDGVWRAYDVNVNTGAKTLVSSFTDFSAFVGNTRYQYFTSVMTYVGNDTLRVISIENTGQWKCYDVNVNTGAKQLVPTFTNFWAFRGRNSGATSQSNVLASAMAYYVPPPRPANEFTLAPGQSTAITVRCRPQREGATVGTVAFVSNAGTQTRIVSVGVGEPILQVSPEMLDYGQIQPGEHKDMSFVVRNPGQGLLTGTAQSSNPNFVVLGDGRFSLAAGQEVQIDIRFCPTTVDTFWGQITFTSNAGTQMKVVTGNARIGKRVRLID